MSYIDNFKKAVVTISLLSVLLTGCEAQDYAMSYEAETYNTNIYQSGFLTSEIAFSKEDVSFEGEPDNSAFYSAGLFDVDNANVLYSNNIYQQIYPASTTKILTALVALENADPSEIVTVSDNADCGNFSSDEQTCGIYAGDQMTLEALLGGLLLYSGNDNAVAIADYIGGSVEDFADMMNQEAEKLLATDSHFVNPNGLQDEDHYTTAYDLYLIFNECIKHDEFVNIISSDYYTAEITDSDGNIREQTWYPTNYYATGLADLPSGALVIGGKTGTTDEAGSCLILLDETEDGHKYISIIMGAEDKDILYNDMTQIIDYIPESSYASDNTYATEQELTDDSSAEDYESEDYEFEDYESEDYGSEDSEVTE